METIEYYYYYLATLFTGFPLVIKIAVVLILIMASLYVISWFSIGKGFYNKNVERRRKKSLETIVENIDYLLSTEDVVSEQEILSRLEIGNPVKEWKKIYLSEYLMYEIDLRPVNESNLATMIGILGLAEYWENQLESGDVTKRWRAIRMLDSMSDFVPASVISKHATLSREGVGKYAKAVFTKFESHDAFKFLEEDLGENLSDLDKLRIHNSLKERPAEEVLPHLLRTAMNTTNENYQQFLIKEIGFLGRTDGVDALIDLYKSSPNANVRAEIVHTLGNLNFQEALPVFIKDYNFVKPIVQDAIIDAAGKIGGKESLDFLEKIYHHAPNKETLIKILMNIYKIEGIGTPVFNRLKAQNKNGFNNTVFSFVENQHI
ncbi:MAG TPA: HEAT repeat domain-containing protein [Flavobacteriaceae bacterium]|nr:HEAT repeat domain-containing protein [Flavobacteriaceae bacterium]